MTEEHQEALVLVEEIDLEEEVQQQVMIQA
jgi:hypothetical protein